MKLIANRIAAGVFGAVGLVFFTCIQARAGAFDEWSYKIHVDVPGYNRSETLSGFPLLLVLGTNVPGFTYSAFSSPDVWDLRVADSDDTTELYYEIEEWNTNGQSYIWVKIPSLTTNYSFTVYSCNPAITSAPACAARGAVWDGNYKAVWHLNQTNSIADLRDSTVNQYNGVSSTTSNEAGKIANGQRSFSGSSISVPSYTSVRPIPFTLTAWLKVETDGAGVVLDWQPYSGQGAGWILANGKMEYSENNSFMQMIRAYSQTLINLNQWVHVAVTRNSSGNCVFYLNGALDGTGTSGKVDNRGFSGMGKASNSVMDEVSISTVIRSENWIWASWLSQATNSVFNNYGPLTFISKVNNDGGASNVAASSATLNGLVMSTNGGVPDVSVFWGTSDGGMILDNWEYTNYLGPQGLGKFSTPVSELTPDTGYFYRCYGSNATGESWADTPSFFITGDIIAQTVRTPGSEAGDTIEFAVQRSASCTGGDTVVSYQMSGVAVAGSDYISPVGYVTIPAGSTSAAVVITAYDDFASELEESVILTVTTGPYVIGSPASAEGSIIDNDGMAWPWKVKVKFQGYSQPDALQNFPALVVLGTNLPGFSYGQFASPEGYDLTFSDPLEMNELNFEIEEWNTNGLSYVWVRVPEIASADSYIWAYWGATNETQALTRSFTEAVWDSNYEAVWHLDRTNGAPDWTDSTSKHMNGSNAVATNAEGKAACALDAAAGALVAPFNSCPTPPRTIEAWIKVPQGGSGGIATWHGTWANFSVNANGKLQYNEDIDISPMNPYWEVVSGQRVDNGTFVHVAARRDIGNCTLSINGASDGFASALSAPTKTYNLGIGSGLNGVLDELRLSRMIRSPTWLWTCWKNAADNAEFLSVLPMIYNTSPTEITESSAMLNGMIAWEDSVPSVAWICWGTNDMVRDFDAWENKFCIGEQGVGPLSHSISLQPDTSYFYRWYATNVYRQCWGDPAETFITGEITVRTTDPVAMEDGSNTAEFAIDRTAACSAGQTMVSYEMRGTAINGTDYQVLNGVVAIPPGSTSVTVTVTPIDDQVWNEPAESVTLALLPGRYRVGAPNEATAWIKDNDLFTKWLRCLQIQFTGCDEGVTLNEFPALVVLGEYLTGFRYSDFASTNGWDLRFTDDLNTSNLSFEVEEWNTNGLSFAWVRVPTLTRSTTIRALWGNSNGWATAAPPICSTNGSAWAPDHRLVCHFAAGAGNPADSTSNRLALVNNGMSYSSGLAANCAVADSAGDNLTFPAVQNNALSAGLWYYFDNVGGDDWNTVLGKGGASNYTHLIIQDSDRVAGFNNDAVWSPSSTALDTGEWHFLYFTADGANYNLYHDGDLTPILSSSSFFGNANRNMSVLGSFDGALRTAWGRFDEFRVDEVVRSPEWIRACYLNMASNAVFNTYFPVELVPLGSQIILR